MHTLKNSFKTVLLWAVKLFVYYMALFFATRLFLLVVLSIKTHSSIASLLPSLQHALYLDACVCCYGVIVGVLLQIMYSITKFTVIKTIHTIFCYTITIICALVVTGESLLYPEWHTKLNVQALSHFKNPKEVFATGGIGDSIYFFVSSICISGLFIYVYRKLVQPAFVAIQNKWYLMAALPILAICGIGLRGGLQPIPVQISDACKTSNTMLNDIAINPFFSLAANIREYYLLERATNYLVMDSKTANAITDSIFTANKKFVPPIWLDSAKPNIVYIILESWSADVLQAVSVSSFTPNITKLSQEGILFTNCFNAGMLSDQGIPALLSAHPVLTQTSIINQSSKSLRLPCIADDLKQAGYQTGFFFGGQLSYGNIKNYVLQHKYDIVKEQGDLQESTDFVQRLGICDGDMANHFLAELNNAKPPFFYNWFTVSTHHSYDIPAAKQNLTAKENEYTNTIVYADSVLGRFFETAKKQAWYANTVFVLVSDHSHPSHLNEDTRYLDRNRIALLIVGNPINAAFKGKQIAHRTSQLQVSPSILQAVGLPITAYRFGSNLFNNQNLVAPFVHFNGCGIITDSAHVCFEKTNMQIPSLVTGRPKVNDTLHAKAIAQSIFEDFVNR
jgi:phosphoglycerol transferase MdoB-like AlkP superfamily enzyme